MQQYSTSSAISVLLHRLLRYASIIQRSPTRHQTPYNGNPNPQSCEERYRTFRWEFNGLIKNEPVHREPSFGMTVWPFYRSETEQNGVNCQLLFSNPGQPGVSISASGEPRLSIARLSSVLLPPPWRTIRLTVFYSTESIPLSCNPLLCAPSSNPERFVKEFFLPRKLAFFHSFFFTTFQRHTPMHWRCYCEVSAK